MLAEEQAALRRVATLVARDVPPDEVFAAVTVEVVRLLPVDFARMGRYESDGTVTTVAASGRTDAHFPVGRRLAPGWKNLGRIVAQTGRSARVDSVADAPARAVSPPGRWASARRSRRRSSSRAACGA